MVADGAGWFMIVTDGVEFCRKAQFDGDVGSCMVVPDNIKKCRVLTDQQE